MTYRTVGASGPYPEWLRKLRHESGVYSIRSTGLFGLGKSVLYVGESHTGNLYKTITRHFQGWRRKKDFWGGMFNTTDPGRTYKADDGPIDLGPDDNPF